MNQPSTYGRLLVWLTRSLRYSAAPNEPPSDSIYAWIVIHTACG